jgi:hypothetical protein
MTGEEHYTIAEGLLETADGTTIRSERADYLQAAQVHATLALAAVMTPPRVVVTPPSIDMSREEFDAALRRRERFGGMSGGGA